MRGSIEPAMQRDVASLRSADRAVVAMDGHIGKSCFRNRRVISSATAPPEKRA